MVLHPDSAFYSQTPQPIKAIHIEEIRPDHSHQTPF